MAPRRISKINTSLQFVLLAGMLAVAASQLAAGPWLPAMLYLSAATIVASGASYVLFWSRKAGNDIQRRTTIGSG